MNNNNNNNQTNNDEELLSINSELSNFENDENDNRQPRKPPKTNKNNAAGPRKRTQKMVDKSTKNNKKKKKKKMSTTVTMKKNLPYDRQDENDYDDDDDDKNDLYQNFDDNDQDDDEDDDDQDDDEDDDDQDDDEDDDDQEDDEDDTKKKKNRSNKKKRNLKSNNNNNMMMMTKNDQQKQMMTTPSNKMMMFNSMNNLKMTPNKLNQVLPVEFVKKNFQVIWKDVSYEVSSFQRSSFKTKTKKILTNLSGSFQSEQITAIMGPSGAGKSTFLEVIACRKAKGISGSLKVRNIDKIRIAYVPQNNYLMEKLTVNESLKYACLLSYSTSSLHLNYGRKVEKLIERFGLQAIRDTPVSRCSGGQQKRISIALELFSKPNLLILDEPTTGLDSSSCSLVCQILKELVTTEQYPMAILATIHQPSWSVFTEFDNVYILTRRGQHLFSGSPNRLLSLLTKVNMPCGKHNSPSDYIIEIAAEDYGTKPVELIQAEFEYPQINDNEFKSLSTVEESRVIRKTPFFRSLGLLMRRSGIMVRRNMFMNISRIISIIMITAWLGVMFGADIGKVSGCPMRKLELYNIPFDKLSSLFEEGILSVTQNSCALFFGLMVGMISGMTTTVLEFPREMHILMKEYNNGWYSCLSYYITKTVIDIPMQILVPSIYVVYIYEYTHQPKQYFREFYLWSITMLVGFTSESIGSACSAIFMSSPSTAAFVAGAIPMPMVMFGGFLVKYSRMPILMRAVSWLSLMKYAFQGLMISIYGFQRCEYSYNEFLSGVNASAITKPMWAEYLPYVLNSIADEATKNETAGMDEDDKAIFSLYTSTFKAIAKDNTTKLTFEKSLILNYYEFNDDNTMYTSLVAMIVYFIVLKIGTYFVILGKLKHGN